MFDPKKVKELRLDVDISDPTVCMKELGLPCEDNLTCTDCYKIHTTNHVKHICETERFVCYECDIVKSVLKNKNIKELGCDDCKKLIKDYITTDFKKMFNGFKTGGDN